MKFVRRASLVFSLVLIVAIAVGYVARRSELAGERDSSLTTAAEFGATQMNSLIDVVETAALAGTDPSETSAALAASNPGLGVCAVSADGIKCDGDGPRPPIDAAEDLQAARAGQDEFANAGASVQVYDSLLAIEVAGPRLSVLVHARVDVVAAQTDLPARNEIRVWATTFIPDGAVPGEFAVEDGKRQTATSVLGAPGLYAVATGSDAVELPGEEQRFYMIIFGLAVLLLGLAGATLVAEQRNLLERASFDQLTRLPNRGEFERRATEALVSCERQDTNVCLLLFDLNGFKLVNDTYGHNVGDEMLKTVARRLRRAVRDDDIVARWGGDEFVVAMPGIESEEMGARRARQLADQIGGRTRLDGLDESLRVKVSVGVALWPAHGAGLDELIEAADKAMYQAKREGLVCRVAEAPREPPRITTHA